MRVMVLMLVFGVIAFAPASARALDLAGYGVASPKRAEFLREGGQPPAPPPPPPSPDAPPAPPPNYTYSPEGRRDPFVSIFGRGTTDPRTAPGQKRPEGVAGLAVDEISIRGIVQTRGAWVAMVGAPNGRTYTIRAGDRLLDGSVKAIDAQTVILLQDVNDPLSLAKQREVRKYLRGEVK